MNVSKTVAIAVALLLALGTADAWAAKKKRIKGTPAPPSTILRDAGGAPIIMKGYPTFGIPDIMREERPRARPSTRAEQPMARPRSNSSYVPPPVPSPSAPNSPPPAVLLQMPPPSSYPPPAANSLGDRVINCIHAAPLNAGVGSNPGNSQMYIRQCAN
jgi:hypothetical protein